MFAIDAVLFVDSRNEGEGRSYIGRYIEREEEEKAIHVHFYANDIQFQQLFSSLPPPVLERIERSYRDETRKAIIL